MGCSLAKNTADMVLVALVIEAGSISAASRRAGLDRSALGRRLAALERRIGLSLFDRSSQKVRLTGEGESYARYCLRIRDIVGRAESLASRQSFAGSEVLRICARFEEAGTLLSPLIDDFVAANEHIDVSISVPTAGAAENTSDFGVVLEIAEIGRRAADTVNVSAVRRSLWAGTNYLSAHALGGDPRTIADLNCLSVADASDGAQTWQLGNGSASVRIDIASSFRLPTLVACRNACIDNIGVAILPDYLCADAEKKGSLVRAAPKWQPDAHTLTASCSADSRQEPALRSFIEFVHSRTV